jgi:hypothetical protein
MTKQKLKKISSHPATSSLLSIVSVVLVVTAVATLGIRELLPSHAATPNNFTTNSVGQIIDPDGKVFIPVGANANGPNSPWPGHLVGNSSLAINAWKWNTLRLTACLDNQACENAGGYHNDANNNLAAIVNEYTAKHVVLMIDFQQLNPGTDANAQQVSVMTNWWTNIAKQYAGNPYVWFNLENEPSGSTFNWVSVQGQIAAAIRNTGATNMIVVDATDVGQDSGNWSCNADIPYGNSAIINGGPSLKAKYGTAGNLMFDMHVYGHWGGAAEGACTQAQLKTRFSNYIDHVHAAGLAVVVGEAGAEETVAEEQWYETGEKDAYHAIYAEAPIKGVGVLAWHSAPEGNQFPMVKNRGGWTAINSQTNPTNLTELGQAAWDYGQLMAKSAPQTPAPPPAPAAPSAAGTYNDTVLTYTGSWQVSNDSPKYQGDDHYSSNASDSATLQFTGSQVKLYGGEGPTYGKVSMSIDGGTAITVDLYAAARADQAAFFASPALTNGTHTIKVTVLGTKNSSSTDMVVSLDKVDIIQTAPATLPGDINGDGHVNTLDLSILIAHDGQNYVAADLNHDGTVGAADLAIMLANWTW